MLSKHIKGYHVFLKQTTEKEEFEENKWISVLNFCFKLSKEHEISSVVKSYTAFTKLKLIFSRQISLIKEIMFSYF